LLLYLTFWDTIPILFKINQIICNYEY
jgi:hypothetical protein